MGARAAGARQGDHGRGARGRGRAQITGTFRPGDPAVAFGLYAPNDGNFPLQAQTTKSSVGEDVVIVVR